MNCKNCHEEMLGDGYTSAYICPHIYNTVASSCREPDAEPIYCVAGEAPEQIIANLLELYERTFVIPIDTNIHRDEEDAAYKNLHKCMMHADSQGVQMETVNVFALRYAVAAMRKAMQRIDDDIYNLNNDRTGWDAYAAAMEEEHGE